MRSEPVSLTFEVELEPGEELRLPPELLKCVRGGRWVINLRPATQRWREVEDPTGFLSAYVPEDEGLYDDLVPG
jgi:hypothetical protein